MTALAEECIALLERVVEAATEGSVGIEIQPPYRNLSFAIAGRIEFDLETRQQILELTSEKGRLEKVRELLSAAAERLERERQAREKAQRNGHLRGDWQPGGSQPSGISFQQDELVVVLWCVRDLISPARTEADGPRLIAEGSKASCRRRGGGSSPRPWGAGP